IREGAKLGIDRKEDVYLGGDLLRVKYREFADFGEAIATLTLKTDAKSRLHWNCTECEVPCVHVGGLLSVLLENKTRLGLAEPPKQPVAVESLDEAELIQRAVEDRAERARNERMKIR